ncbi:hypothetical protein [Streptomyces sp. NPDC017991]|uniref:hypothetical protein n=1 Tax=Streptomyces sp. NPDC017991 TaxID=3365026 RepID=UPI00378DFE3A
MQLSTSNSNTGTPASGACSTASVCTVARLRPALGNAIATSVDQELTEPTPAGAAGTAGAAGSSARAAGMTTAAVSTAGRAVVRRTGQVGSGVVRVMAMTVSFTAIASGAPERAAPSFRSS